MEAESDDDGDQTHEQMKIVTLIVVFLLKFQIFYKISDNAIVTLLRFFKYLLLIIGRTYEIKVLQEELNVPQSIHGCRSLTGIANNPFKEFPVCPACHMLFDCDIQKLVVGTGHNRRSVKCNFHITHRNVSVDLVEPFY